MCNPAALLARSEHLLSVPQLGAGRDLTAQPQLGLLLLKHLNEGVSQMLLGLHLQGWLPGLWLELAWHRYRFVLSPWPRCVLSLTLFPSDRPRSPPALCGEEQEEERLQAGGGSSPRVPQQQPGAAGRLPALSRGGAAGRRLAAGTAPFPLPLSLFLHNKRVCSFCDVSTGAVTSHGDLTGQQGAHWVAECDVTGRRMLIGWQGRAAGLPLDSRWEHWCSP